MASKKLQGQVALITGASRGLGAGIAQRFARAGASLIITARSEESLAAEAERLQALGGDVVAVPADVSDPEQLQAVFDQALERHQRLDILVNNAGVVWPIEEVAEADPDEWVYNIHTNLIAPFYALYCALPIMNAQGYGRIVNIGSGLARLPVAGLSAYSAAKAGLDQLTRVLALEVANRGIAVNVLYPGVLDTDMQMDLRSVDTSDSVLNLEMFHQFAESKQLVSVDSAARLAYWLVGPWSRGRSGEIFSSTDSDWIAQVDRDLDES